MFEKVLNRNYDEKFSAEEPGNFCRFVRSAVWKSINLGS